MPYIWRVAAVALVSFLLGGCGLPQYTALPAPEVESTSEQTTLAFKTPSDVSSVTGYVLYYKLYTSETDFDDQDDEKWFLESTYTNDNDEMQPGDTIPRQRGFIKMGIAGDSELSAFQVVDEDLVEQVITIDFDPGPDPNGNAVINDTNNPPEVNSVVLARGINDPDDPGYPKEFRSFVADWDWDDDDGDGYNDADFYRDSNLPSFSDSAVDSLVSHLQSEGELISLSPGGSLIIGVAVYSYGYDAGPPPTIIYSKPIFLGKVTYNPINDANRD